MIGCVGSKVYDVIEINDLIRFGQYIRLSNNPNINIRSIHSIRVINPTKKHYMKV